MRYVLLCAAAAVEVLTEEFARAALLVAVVELVAVVHQTEDGRAHHRDDDETCADRADAADRDHHDAGSRWSNRAADRASLLSEGRRWDNHHQTCDKCESR